MNDKLLITYPITTYSYANYDSSGYRFGISDDWFSYSRVEGKADYAS